MRLLSFLIEVVTHIGLHRGMGRRDRHINCVLIHGHARPHVRIAQQYFLVPAVTLDDHLDFEVS